MVNQTPLSQANSLTIKYSLTEQSMKQNRPVLVLFGTDPERCFPPLGLITMQWVRVLVDDRPLFAAEVEHICPAVSQGHGV